METHYSPEQEAFRDSVRRCLEDLGGPGFTRAQWNAASGTNDEAWQALTALGIPGLLVPESTGGVGGDMSDMGVVMEETGRTVHSSPVLASAVGGVSAAAAFGVTEVLEALACGEARACIALQDAGQIARDWRATDVQVNDHRISGRKVQVPDALDADYFFVTTARGAYLVRRDEPGVSIEAEECLDGTHRFATVHLDAASGVHLGDNAELANSIDRVLVAISADGIGAAERTLEMTVAYASERQQFGQAIGAFQAVQHLCADMLQQLELGRAGLHYALWAVDHADEAEGHRAAVMCKAYVADVLPKLGASAIQVFGGAGFTWEYDIQLYYKRLLSTQMTLGCAQTWLEELATLVIDQEAPPIVPEH